MGFGLDQRFWAAQIPIVSEHHRFITFDNRGTGRSAGAAGAYSIDEMTTDAVALLDHLDIADAAIFGVSMGGAIAQRLVLEHPDRVSALILAVTWARPIEFMRRQSDVARRILASNDPGALVDLTLLRMFSPRFFEYGGAMLDQMVASLDATGAPETTEPRVLRAQLDAIDSHDTLADLPRISCPTLVMGGKSDMLVPGFGAEEIAAAIPGAELAMFESGHGVAVEEMGSFNERVAEFLGRLR